MDRDYKKTEKFLSAKKHLILIKLFSGYRLKIKSALTPIINTVLGWKYSLTVSADSIAVSILKIPSKLSSIKESQASFADSISNQSSIAQELASSTEELDAAVQSILTDISSINSISLKTQNLALNSKDSLDKCINLTSGISQKSQAIQSSNDELQKELSEFQKSLTNINGWIDDIKEISERTNILSVNAAIEAAHAKQEGAGFAVISKEIFNLAASTKETVSTIKKSIQTINEKFILWKQHSSSHQNYINSILKDMELMLSAIKESDNCARTTGNEITNLANFINDINSKLEEIKIATEFISIRSENLFSQSENLISANDTITSKVREISDFIESSVRLITTQNPVWLYDFIHARRLDHIRWVQNVEKAIDAFDPNLIPETNHTKCNMGLWYYSSVVSDPEQERIHKQLEEPHRLLHASGHRIKDFLSSGNKNNITGEKEKLVGYYQTIAEIFNEYERFLEKKALELN